MNYSNILFSKEHLLSPLNLEKKESLNIDKISIQDKKIRLIFLSVIVGLATLFVGGIIFFYCLSAKYKFERLNQEIYIKKNDQTELRNSIKSNIPNILENETRQLTIAIAKKINKLSMKASRNSSITNTSKRVSKKTNNIPRSFYIEKTKVGFHVQVYGKKKLGEGGYKKIKTSNSFDIDTEKQVVSHTKTALARIYSKKDYDLVMDGSNTVYNTIRNHETLNIAPALQHAKRYYPKNKQLVKYEGELPIRYAYDFSRLLFCFKSRKINLTFMQKLINNLSEISSVVKVFHENNLVHRDIKPANILMLESRAYLSDFDLVNSTGKNTYRWWDKKTEEGNAVKSGDLYGLTISLGEVVFRSRTFKNFADDKKELQSDTFHQILVEKDFLTEVYNRVKPFDKIIKVFDKNIFEQLKEIKTSNGVTWQTEVLALLQAQPDLFSDLISIIKIRKKTYDMIYSLANTPHSPENEKGTKLIDHFLEDLNEILSLKKTTPIPEQS